MAHKYFVVGKLEGRRDLEVCKGGIRLAGNWKELYAQELSDYPKIADLLSDGDRLLDIAGLTRDEREAWKLKGQLSEAEIASVLKRQRKTVQALVERAEFKLKGLRQTLAEPKRTDRLLDGVGLARDDRKSRTIIGGASAQEHSLLSGPCSIPDCSLVHWFCSCGEWTGSTVLGEEGNRQEWIAHSVEAIYGDL